MGTQVAVEDGIAKKLIGAIKVSGVKAAGGDRVPHLQGAGCASVVGVSLRGHPSGGRGGDLEKVDWCH